MLWQRYFTDAPEYASEVRLFLFDQLQSVQTVSSDDGTAAVYYPYSYSYFDFGDTQVGPQALSIGAPFENVPRVSNSEFRAALPRLRAGFYPAAYGRGNGWVVPAAQLNAARCSMLDGALVVHEVQYDALGSLTRLAADYSVNCGNIRVNSNGAIRHRSAVPLALDAVYVVPWRDHDVVEGRPIRLDGSLSWGPASKVNSLTWRQVSGPTFDLSDCSSGVCRTFVPLVPRGGASAVFELTATTESGRTATGTLRLGLRSLHDRQTLVETYGAPQDLVFTDRDGAFGLPIRHGSQAIHLAQRPDRFAVGYAGSNINGIGRDPLLSVSLSNTAGVPLVPGAYSGTEVDSLGMPAPYPSASYAGGAPQSCVHPTWSAVLSDLRRDPADLTKLQGLGYWFTLECPDGDAVHARFWLDYQPVTPPTAVAAGPSTVARGTAAVMRDGGSSAPQGGIALRSWQQVFGPAVDSLELDGDASARFVPAANTPDGTRLVFAYRVFDQLRQPGVTLLSVTVQGGPSANDRGSAMSAAQRKLQRPYAIRMVEKSPADATSSRR